MTIYDIAQEAGVSASTVSRVLNNKKGVNAKTRQQIEALLRKYNFEPNASAQGLVCQASRLIGILMSDIRTQHHSESAFYIENQLQKHGYSCMIMNTGFSDKKREEGIRLMASRRVEAVVMIGSTFQSEPIKRCIQKYLKNMPVVLENGFLDLPNVYGVITDERGGIADCLEYLYRQGRKAPFFVNMNDTPSNRLKIEGFCSVWAAHNPNQSDPPVYSIDPDPRMDDWDNCFKSTKKMLQEHPETDCLIYATDLLANAGERALLEMHYKIPEQIAIIGVDNSIYSKLSYPRLTTLDNKMSELSMMCATILVHLLNNEPVANKTMIMTEIIYGETT